ncbi:trimeric intracellular cation channel family protein [Mesorhizobium loti]|uniref:trimeric intracellular cation channel family protein n=1 Tax=Mesorhizobium TaxID=68287 RepID=UPI000ABDCE0E|nr:trimeric intracellular cation channel family protein [Mesorhizobium loti]
MQQRRTRCGRQTQAEDSYALRQAAALLDWLGLIVFAISGALVASRKQMNVVGFVLLGTVTGIGGGTLRDLLLGLSPVFWVREPAVLLACVIVSCAVFFTAHIPQSRYRLLLWLDDPRFGTLRCHGCGARFACRLRAVVAVAMGVVTATFGGIIRDVLGNESPIVLSREVYVTAALAGAIVFVVLTNIGLSREVVLGAGLIAGLLVRGMALHKGWSLPRYRERRGRTPDEIDRLDRSA